MGALRDRLCAAADDAVRRKAPGQLRVMEFDRMQAREDGAGATAAGGGGIRLQQCDLDYRWAMVDISRCGVLICRMLLDRN
jgi:hypothetical protein